MNQVTVKRMSTDEVNVSRRTVWYDIYVNGHYHSTTDDVIVACELKEKLERGNKRARQQGETK
ncbi:hypothetical protein [Orrella sp. 11846]|uniref:hypothetical protein n=1 Tax=Orrella sp. 11846 TaxID=3409913 RepID=UPI003B5C07DF